MGAARASLIPVEEFAFIEQRRSIRGDVAAFPCIRLRGENPRLLAPLNAVGGDGEAGVPRLTIEAGVKIKVFAVAANHRRIEDVYRLPAAGRERGRGVCFPL